MRCAHLLGSRASIFIGTFSPPGGEHWPMVCAAIPNAVMQCIQNRWMRKIGTIMFYDDNYHESRRCCMIIHHKLCINWKKVQLHLHTICILYPSLIHWYIDTSFIIWSSMYMKITWGNNIGMMRIEYDVSCFQRGSEKCLCIRRMDNALFVLCNSIVSLDYKLLILDIIMNKWPIWTDQHVSIM